MASLLILSDRDTEKGQRIFPVGKLSFKHIA